MQHLTKELISSLLHYDPSTGIFTWKVSRGGVYQGNRAGSLNKMDYRYISIKKTLCLEHRIAWLLTYGEWPTQQIDHINRDRSDNRIANLRLVTQSQNNQNSYRRFDNNSGEKGVSFDTQTNKWRAVIKINNKQVSLGRFSDKSKAVKARKEAEKKYFGEFAAN